MDAFIRQLFNDPQLLRMGHDQREADLNLGLGWLYYSLGRMLRPKLAVVIGSYRGFVPAVMAKGLLDNVEGGELLFIDPSLVDSFWTEPAAVTQRFADLGTPNVRHVRHTTQDFVTTPEYAALADVGLLMVDGFHSAEQARFDYLAFLPKLGPQAMVLFHDSVKRRRSTFYGADKAYDHSVCDFMQRLRQTPGLEVMDFPLGGGLTMVRGQPQTMRVIEAPFEDANAGAGEVAA